MWFEDFKRSIPNVVFPFERKQISFVHPSKPKKA